MRLKLLLAALGLASFIGLSTGRAGSQSGTAARQNAAPVAARKAEEQFKNIQTLKGIPADQVFPTMQFIAASLGVECDFCHVQGAFEKDDKKPKQTARKMIDMMFAINKNSFDGHREVTCYSCHHGSPNPAGTPIISTAEPAPGPSGAKTEANTALPPADQIFDKYVQALGSASAVDKVTSRSAKGTIDFGGKQLPIDVYSKDPDKRASFAHLPGGDNITAFDGHQGWLGVPGRPVHEMHGPDLDAAAIDADLHFATHLKQMFAEAKTESTERVGEHSAYLVVGRRADKPPIRLYFDEQSGFLLRMVRYAETALGRLPTQIDYEDYRNSGGVKIPYRWTLARPGGRFTIQLSEVTDNVTVDDGKFVKPPATVEPPKEATK